MQQFVGPCPWRMESQGTVFSGGAPADFYGLPRPTGDIDYYSAVPANLNLIEMAGEGSALAKNTKFSCTALPLRICQRTTRQG
jgi:hypothetical protein